MITKTKAQNWRTPRPLFLGLHREKRYTRDCAASLSNRLLPRFWTRAHNTLNQKLDEGEYGFTNPPFGLIRKFLEWGYAQREYAWTDFLVPANIETKWFLEVAVKGNKECFDARVAYEPPAESYDLDVSAPSFASIIVSFGPGVIASDLAFSALRDGRTGEIIRRCVIESTRDLAFGGATKNIIEREIRLQPLIGPPPTVSRFTLNYDPKAHIEVKPRPPEQTDLLLGPFGARPLTPILDADAHRVPNPNLYDSRFIDDDLPF